MRTMRRAATAVLSVMLATVITVAQSGAATASTDEVSEALASTTGVAQASDSARVDVTVPTTGSSAVVVKGEQGGQLRIGLPNKGGKAKKSKRGATTYASSTGTSDAVIPTAEGVQMLTVIKHRKAPQRYTYDMGGNKVALTPEGGAIITNPQTGEVIAGVPPAWAKDANGKAIPTRFVTDGKSLTQIVEHKQANAAYPIVADPIVVWLMGVTVVCFIQGTYEARNLQGKPWYMWLWGMAVACI